MSKKLLLADDSITIQKVVGITFAQEDFDITYVDNGLDAINKVGSLKPDIVLADIVMPQKNGYDVCEAVKKNPDLKHIPVLLLAGTFETFDVNRGKLVGADDYIIKPFESQALIDKVNHLLNAKSASTAAPAAAPVATQVAAAPPPPAQDIEVGSADLGIEGFGSEEVSAATDFGFDLPEIQAHSPLPISGPTEVTEASPIHKSIESDAAIPMASAAELMMDMHQQSPASQGIDLPATDDFNLSEGYGDVSADPFGLSGTTEDKSEGIDLPPLPDDNSTLDSESFVSDMNSLAAAPVGVASTAVAHTMPQISEAQVKQMIEERVKEVLEKIAWEVIPDLAERLIQAEIKRLVSDANSK